MKWTLLIGSLLLATAEMANGVGEPAAEARWLTSLDEAKAAARKTGKPIFAVFR